MVILVEMGGVWRKARDASCSCSTSVRLMRCVAEKAVAPTSTTWQSDAENVTGSRLLPVTLRLSSTKCRHRPMFTVVLRFTCVLYIVLVDIVVRLCSISFMNPPPTSQVSWNVTLPALD